MVSDRRLRMRPWPLHSLQGSLMTVPKPSQHAAGCGRHDLAEDGAHGPLDLAAAAADVAAFGWLPSRQQEPSQVGQTTAVSTSSFLLTPKTASRRSIRTLMRASWPRRTRDAGPAVAAGAEEGVEDVLEREALAGVAAAAEAVVRAVLVARGVIDPALLRIGEHLVGVGDGLESVRRVSSPGFTSGCRVRASLR